MHIEHTVSLHIDNNLTDDHLCNGFDAKNHLAFAVYVASSGEL